MGVSGNLYLNSNVLRTGGHRSRLCLEVAVAHRGTVLEVMASMRVCSVSFAVLPGSIFDSLEDRF